MRQPTRRFLGPSLRAACAAATLVLMTLPVATGQVHAAGTAPNLKGAPAPKVHATHSVVPLVAASGAVVVTNCTTAGYNNYILGTPNNIGLGGALANGNVITFACNATLSGAGPYTIVVPQATSPLVQVNTATFSGGALSIDGSDGGKFDVTVDGGSTSATGVQLFFVDSTGSLTLSNITLTHAHATAGNTVDGFGAGGAVESNGTLTLTNDTFAGNAADLFGGAVESNAGAAQITGSTFAGNSAVGGSGAVDSGIVAGGGTYVIANSTFVGNTAPSGGVTFFPLAAVSFINVTIDGNSGTDIFVSSGVTPSVANTILANDTSGAACDSAVTDNGGNVEYPTNTCGFTLASDSLGNPDLGSLANNGGPTQTEALGAGSAAINQGLAVTCEAAPVNDVDQRGLPRYAVQRGVCDSGAYDTGGGIVEPLTITGAFPLTRFPAGPARLGFAASNNGTFTGVALSNFPVGYITFQLGGSLFTVRQPVTIACTSALAAGDHCFGAVGLVNGAPGFVVVPGTATLTLSGFVSTGHGAYAVGALATVTLTVSASATGVITVSAVSVSVNGIPQVTWTAPFPFGTSLIIQTSLLFVP